MEFFDFGNQSDKDTLHKLFLEHFKRQNIVPFFGSGFTRGYPAARGRVPSVDELKAELVDILAGIENYTDNARGELNQLKLSGLSDIFWSILERDDIPKEYRDRFDAYIEDHFYNVHDIPVACRKLIDCRWRYLYTLNYDDAIENASNELRVIVPYTKQNKQWLKQKKCLYKIHGDSAKFLETGESKFCILSTQQYLQALNDRDNLSMRQNLETDFSSNNLIFFGCSLLDELDILFAAGTKFAKGKQQNGDTRSYYVRYVNDKTPNLSVVQRQMFKNFAITDIIEVRAEDMLSFYSFIAKASDEAGQLQKTDNLSEFTGFRFLQRESTSRENIEYLFFSSHIWPKRESKQIVLPGFFIHRDETQQIVNAIKNSDGHFHVLRGGRLSGKTYALIDLLQVFNARKTYYFSSNRQISDQCFEHLLSLNSAILIFDEHSLSGDQLMRVTLKYKDIIQKNGIQIVTAIDRSAGMFTKHYFDRFPEMSGFVKIYSLPAGLSEKEAGRFNSKFGDLGVIDYENGWSFLDFMLKVDDASTQKHGVYLPNINVIQDLETLKALILFANQERIPISQGNMMGITEKLYNLCKTADVAVQKDYLSEAELASDTHDSFCFVVNSKYWVYKCLSTYAINQTNYDLIAEAYYEIVNTIQHQHSGHQGQSYYQSVKPYYFFDTIQLTFFPDHKQVGSLFLPEVIYEKLLPLFRDDFQFLHQKVKCLLWNSKRKRNSVDRASMLNEALQQITRASNIVEKRNPVNMEYTLYHMKVTRTLILVNNWRYCQMQFEEAELSKQLSSLLKTFYEMVQDMLKWGVDSELDDREMEDLNWFVSQLVTTEVLQKMLPGDRKTAGRILTSWKQKKL